MRSRQARALLFTGCVLMFACLFLSGSQRLIASSHEEDVIAVQRVQAFLCSALSCEAGRPSEGSVCQQRDKPWQMEGIAIMRRLSAALTDVRSDANGNVLTSGVSYWRTVYQSFALGDGFA